MLRKVKNLFHLFEAFVSNFAYGFPGRKLFVIGVTGTEGKTTTVCLIHHILTNAGIKTGIMSTLSSPHMTTPGRWQIPKFLATCVRNRCTHVVLEVSSHAIDQHRLWGIPFQMGVLTNITDNEHLDYHKSFEAYRQTKLNFLRSCRKTVDWEKYKSYQFETKLEGAFNRQNCLAAIAVAKELGLDDGVIRKAVASFEAPPGQFEIVIKKPVTAIIDFGHTPQSFGKTLPLARKYLKGSKAKLIHVFGATGDRYAGKRPYMAKMSARYADFSILTNEDTYFENLEKIVDQIEAGMPKGAKYLKTYDREQAIKTAFQMAKTGDVVILTGVGHQKSMNIKGKEVPWNEADMIKKYVSKE